MKHYRRDELNFLGAQNAGNDAVAKLKFFICSVLDSLLDNHEEDIYDDFHDAHMANVVNYIALHHGIDGWLQKVMHNMNPKLFIICFDAECVEENQCDAPDHLGLHTDATRYKFIPAMLVHVVEYIELDRSYTMGDPS